MYARLSVVIGRLAIRLLVLASLLLATMPSGAPLSVILPTDRDSSPAAEATEYQWSDLPVTAKGSNVAANGFTPTFLPKDSNTTGTSVAVDSAGGVHVAYSPVGANSSGTYLIYYAYCGSNCGVAANWSSTYIGNAGAFGGYARLAVDSQNRLHLLWYQQPVLAEPGDYVYAECNASCLQVANWNTVAVTRSGYPPSDSQFFALDPQGRPRFVYMDTISTPTDHRGTYYVFCDSGCTLLSNWYEGQIASTYNLSNFSLAFDGAGRPRLAYSDDVGVPSYLSYAECDLDCHLANSWSAISPYVLYYGSYFTLRLDSSGRPRLAYYQGNTGGADAEKLTYVWCDTACTADTTNWQLKGLGLPAYHGKRVDLVLDSQNKPNLAYYAGVSPYGLAYSKCTATCESQTPVWQSIFVETSAELQAVKPISGCSISAWYPGQGNRPSIALDAAGNPQIGYDNEHLQGGSCSAQTDIRLVRFASLGGTTGPGTMSSHTYLPLVVRGQ